MAAVCILTDNTAQFTKPNFTGRNLVNIIPLQSLFNNQLLDNENEFKVSNLPVSSQDGLNPCLKPPDIEGFRQFFINLSRNYNEIIVVLLSSRLNPAIINAQKAANLVQGRISVQVIDSQTTSVGLGYLVQIAAEAAASQASSGEIERLLRSLISHIYSVFCIPNLTYLYHAGFIDYGQAIVGEMLGILPIFTLEEGYLTPLEKVRSNRHLIDFIQEFLSEFTDLSAISVVQSMPSLPHEGRAIREHAQSNFPNTPFSEHPVSLPLATLFGPRALGVFAIENSLHK
jgi:DegV family protein with EDD domain